MCIRRFSPLFALLFLAGLPAAQAQIPVIDVASLTQLIMQIQTLEQQLSTARNELAQAQSEYQSITGQRGMQQLLSGTPRNYLPANWPTLAALATGAGGYPVLGGDIRAALKAVGVLTPQQLAALSSADASQLQAQRQSVALLEAITDTAVANASGRFAALQTLIDAIGSANDQKAILELQARISAEQAMLANEHTKLDELYRGSEAQAWANAQRARELTVAAHGQFAARFQPTP
jgi:type IV secretion system protein VirB5